MVLLNSGMVLARGSILPLQNAVGCPICRNIDGLLISADILLHKAFIHILDLGTFFAFVGPVFNDVVPGDIISCERTQDV